MKCQAVKAATEAAGTYTWSVEVTDDAGGRTEFQCLWAPDLQYNETTVRLQKLSGDARLIAIALDIFDGSDVAYLTPPGGAPWHVAGTAAHPDAARLVLCGLCLPDPQGFLRATVAFRRVISGSLPQIAWSPRRLARAAKAAAPGDPLQYLPYVRAGIQYWADRSRQAFGDDQLAATARAIQEKSEFERSFQRLTGRAFDPVADRIGPEDLLDASPIPLPAVASPPAVTGTCSVCGRGPNHGELTEDLETGLIAHRACADIPADY